MAAVIIQGVAVCGFVVAVYALLVGGGIALWPQAGDSWILLLWIAAAAIAGVGLSTVRSHARALAHRVLPAATPYPRLTSLVSGVVAAGPAEDWLPRLRLLWHS